MAPRSVSRSIPTGLRSPAPAGLFGPIAREDLLAEPISSSRNARLAKLVEDVEIEGTGRTVCENRGSGLIAAAALRGVGIEPPELIDVVREFRVVIRNHGLLDDTGLAWLATIDTADLNDRQCLGLAFLHRHGKITNQQYRTITGCDALTATRELTGLPQPVATHRPTSPMSTSAPAAGCIRSSYSGP